MIGVSGRPSRSARSAKVKRVPTIRPFDARARSGVAPSVPARTGGVVCAPMWGGRRGGGGRGEVAGGADHPPVSRARQERRGAERAGENRTADLRADVERPARLLREN